MKNFKKIIAAVAAFALIFSAAGHAPCETVYADGTNEAAALISLGIIGGISEDDYQAFSKVKKCAFVNYVYNLFTDDALDGELNTDAASYLEGLRVLASADEINRSDNITLDEAVKMLVCALGYGAQAESGGGYPSGYLTCASRIRLLNGVSAKSGEQLKMFDAVALLYNAIECDAAVTVAITDGSAEKRVYGGGTIIGAYRSIFEVKGQVTADYFSTIWGESSLSEDEIQIDDTVYKIGDTNADGFLSYPVKAFVKEDKNNSDTILYIAKNSSKYKELTIAAQDIDDVSADGRTVSYTTGSTSGKKVTVSNPRVLLNGAAYPDFTKNDLMPERGSLTVVDTDGDGTYDTIIAEVFETVVVDNTFASEKTVTNRLEYEGAVTKIKLKAEDGGRVEIKSRGAAIGFADIKSGDVLSVKRSRSADRPYIYVSVSGETAGGKVLSISESKKTVKLGDREYKLSEAFIKARKNNCRYAQMNLGSEYTFFLNDAGEIAAADKQKGSGELSFGYAMKMNRTKDLNPVVSIKIFTENQEWVTYEFAKKVKHNGTSGKSAEKMCDELTMYGFLPQLVEYKLNADGKVSELETPIADDGDTTSDRLREKSASGEYRYNDNSFDSKYYLSAASYWLVPSSEFMYDESSYKLTRDRLYLEKDTSYSFIIYNLDDYNFSNQVVIKSASTNNPPISNFFTVSEVSNSLDGNGDNVQTITGSYQNYDKIMFTAESMGMFDDIKEGDVLTVRPNNAGIIPEHNGFKRQYSIDDGIVYNNGNIYTSFMRMSGVVVKNDPAKFRMKVDLGNEVVARRYLDYPYVFIYNDRSKTIERGSLASIEEGDFIVYREFWATITDIVVIRK